MNEIAEELNKTAKELNEKINEIDEIQAKVEKILYSKNPFVRMFRFGEGKRLHELAEVKLQYLTSGQFLRDHNLR